MKSLSFLVMQVIKAPSRERARGTGRNVPRGSLSPEPMASSVAGFESESQSDGLGNRDERA